VKENSLQVPKYEEDTLYDHMPVYHARLAGVRDIIAQPGQLDLNAFHMHYDGLAPLERAADFFDDTGTLLDLGCGYGSNVVWFAHNMPKLKSLLGVDLMSEHIEIANLLTTRFLSDSKKTRFLTTDIAALNKETFVKHAAAPSANSIIALNTFLHLSAEQRSRTWHFIDQVLSKGGKVYVEDFFARRPLTSEQYDTMVRESGCAFLPPMAEHVDLIAKVMPTADIESTDISDSYTAFAKTRHLGYQGDDAAKRRFYKTVFEMLDTGVVGGIRLTVTR
jgi:sarcosine/dimethylglycine N-methyltransferase